jgi:hypothetical protein
VRASADDGLSRFKAGWATGRRTAWFGGRIGDRAAYDALAAGRQAAYFPAYRAPAGDSMGRA